MLLAGCAVCCSSSMVVLRDNTANLIKLSVKNLHVSIVDSMKRTSRKITVSKMVLEIHVKRSWEVIFNHE